MIMITMLNQVKLMFTVAVVGLNGILFICSGSLGMNVNYKTLQQCVGKNGTNYILTAVNNVASADCAIMCEKSLQCALFFYNTKTGSCSLHSRTLADVIMDTEADTVCYMTDGNVDVTHEESWVVERLAESGIISLLPSAITGPDGLLPDEFYSHLECFVELRFDKEMYIDQIEIYEQYYPGGVRCISLMSPGGTWDTVWSTLQLEYLPYGDRVMVVKIKITDYKTSQVRFDIGARGSFYKESIDAVKIASDRVTRSARISIP